MRLLQLFPLLPATVCLFPAGPAIGGEPFDLDFRYRSETAEDSGRFHTFWKKATWDPNKTAIIVCDLWDSHHSVTAARRVNELAPHLNGVLKVARERGATIIHAPSDCMAHYKEHPARTRALGVPEVVPQPEEIASWSYRIRSEEGAVYPIDQTDGGEDEDAWENAQWNATLSAEGREPGTPWLAQHPALEIQDGDYIAAEGDVVWNILKHEGIGHVALAGVHTNMCVLGRPFGLRRMVASGMDTVLVRDCTDLMYNPERWPYANHFTGLDLIVDYIEAHVCPTITSDQLTGGEPFRFRGDRRPHLAMLVGEREYESVRTLPEFARRFLGKDFRVTIAYADEDDRNRMPGVRKIEDADVLFVSVRRRGLPGEDLARIRRFVAAGKPVVGIRTASHAFAPKEDLQEGHASWASFDPDVFGGNYTGHHGNSSETNPGNFVQVKPAAATHPVGKGLPEEEWKTAAWLYKTAPLRAGTQVIAMGRTEGVEQGEPLAWTYVRADGGRSFYTSLGHADDFGDENFLRMLVNACFWAAGLEAPEELAEDPDQRRWEEGWTLVDAGPEAFVVHGTPNGNGGRALWVRTLLRTPADLNPDERGIAWAGEGAEIYFDGKLLKQDGDKGIWKVPADYWHPGTLHLIAAKMKMEQWSQQARPELSAGSRSMPLDGGWQVRFLSETEDGSKFPIPPQFGAPADLIQNWPLEESEGG